MRLPPISDLDQTQRALYADAPQDGSILIYGPPGTGKSVIAIHRAMRLAKTNQPVVLVMFNQVLAQYSKAAGDLPSNVIISTMFRWIDKWFYTAFGHGMPKADRFTPDWEAMTKLTRGLSLDEVSRDLNWGHLIIDEGQDFSVAMYEFFCTVLDKLTSVGATATLSVFADDNQAITQNRSYVTDIMEELGAQDKNKRLWRLDKNYRNSKEVYRCARYFQASGTASAAMPERQAGRKPMLMFLNDEAQIIERIRRISSAAGGQKQIGVITFGTKNDVPKWHTKLSKVFKDASLSHQVQGYTSIYKHELNDVRKLLFGDRHTVTVVHSQSSKGLEFDIVFLVDLHKRGEIFDDQVTDFSKQLYVVCSRPRNFLFVMFELRNESIPPLVNLFPPYNWGEKEENPVDYYTGDDKDLAERLKQIDWASQINPQYRWRDQAKKAAGQLLAMNPHDASALLESMNTRFIHQLQNVLDLKDLVRDEERLIDYLIEIGPERVSSLLERAHLDQEH